MRCCLQDVRPNLIRPASAMNQAAFQSAAAPTLDAILADDAELSLEATLVHNGQVVDVVLPAGVLTKTLAADACATVFLSAFSGDREACVREATLQISRRRSPQMLYRRWVNKKYLMAFPMQERLSTVEGIKVVCDDPYKSHPHLDRAECESIAVKEIKKMRYGGAWKTKTPANAPPDAML